VRRVFHYLPTFLAVLLSVPTILILLSWNALPGDAIYSVKTGLEKIALRVVGGTQLERRLEVKYTERRFGEAEELLSQKSSTLGLAYLLPQAHTAKEKVIEAQDIEVKEELIEDLAEFNQKLEERKDKVTATLPAPTSSPETTGSSPPPAFPSPFPSPPPISAPSEPEPSDPEEIIEKIEETQEEIEDIIEELEKELPVPQGVPDPSGGQPATPSAEESEEGPVEGEVPVEEEAPVVEESPPAVFVPSSEEESKESEDKED